MFKSPQNIKAAGGLPVSWVHFTKEDPGAKATGCVWPLLKMTEKGSKNIPAKFIAEALN